MKKRTVILVTAFLIVLSVTGLLSLSWAAKTKQVTPRDSGELKTPLIRSPWIRGVRIGTEADGRWYWEATIKNNGNAIIKKDSIFVRGWQIMENNQQLPASRQPLHIDLPPGGVTAIKAYWSRCCKTKSLQIDLFDATFSPPKKVTSKTVYVLPKVKNFAKVENISWNAHLKEWTATIKNYTNMAIKIMVQGHGKHSNSSWVGAGGSSMVIPPNGVITQKGQYPGYHPGAGDQLRVMLYFKVDSAFLCGGTGYCAFYKKKITLP